MKYLGMLYSVFCYLIGVISLVYLILFIGNLYVPVTINQASHLSPGLTGIAAILFNLALIGLWGYQHSLMASPGFKAKWTKIVPHAVERSTYLIFVGIFTAILILFWVPMNGVIWDVSGGIFGQILWVTFWAGWGITFLSTFLINHFHLFGLQQAFKGITDQQSKTETFRTPLFYKLVRHPIMTGVFIAIWSAPIMTTGRLILCIGMTAYIVLGIRHEEKALVADLGDEYLNYRKTTAPIIPGLKFFG